MRMPGKLSLCAKMSEWDKHTHAHTHTHTHALIHSHLSYPDEHPEMHISSDQLTRSSQDTLNSDLTKFVSTLPLEEVCLLNAVEWVRENIPSYYSPITTTPPTTQDTRGSSQELTFCCLWLYMHHIYSKTKRRDILDVAGQLNLTGFCLPGKPGVVCVEGEEGVTRHFFSVLRRWNWKSITCRHREMVAGCHDSSDISQQRKLQGFGELDLVQDRTTWTWDDSETIWSSTGWDMCSLSSLVWKVVCHDLFYMLCLSGFESLWH